MPITDPRLPTTPSHSTVVRTTTWSRAAVYCALAGIALLLGLDKSVPIFGVLLAAGLISLIVTPFFKAVQVPLLRTITDTATLLAISIIEQRLWPAALLVVVADVIWTAMRSWRSDSFFAAIVGALTIGLVGIIGQYNDAIALFATSAAVIIVYLQHSRMEHERFGRTADELRRVLTSSAAFVYEVDIDKERYLSFNGPVESMTGWTERQWTNLPQQSIIHPEDFANFWIEPHTFFEGQFIDRKARFQRSDGTYIWLRDIARIGKGAEGLVLRGFAIDVTALEDAYRTIRHQAEHDQLTGLPHRFVLVDQLTSRLADDRGERGTFALLMLDMDRFKGINDSLGHEVGDDVLKALALRLTETMRPGDTIARLGGDEFAVIADGVGGLAAAEAIGQRVALAFEPPMMVRGISVRASVSVGVALSEPGADAEMMLRRADTAMYRAKRSGGDVSVSVYTDVEGSGLSEVMLTAAIPHALEEEQFELYFQPKYDFATERITGVEGLARWHFPEVGLLQPDNFIHLVDLSDSHSDFVDFMLNEGILFAARARADKHDLTVAVNIPVQSLYDDGLPDRVRAMLTKHEVPASSIILEINEKGIMEEAAGAPPVLERLAFLGVGISIDDFGTGYSSLARVRDLPVSEIKIDRRFVDTATKNEADRIIVKSIVDLAANLGLHVVAEGVETEAAAQLLRDAGCDQGQGYLYGEPQKGPELLLSLVGRPKLFTVPDEQVG